MEQKELDELYKECLETDSATGVRVVNLQQLLKKLTSNPNTATIVINLMEKRIDEIKLTLFFHVCGGSEDCYYETTEVENWRFECLKKARDFQQKMLEEYKDKLPPLV